MFEIAVLLCRYVFLFILCFFLLQGLLIVLDEQNIVIVNKDKVLSRQRICIAVFHIIGILILAYNSDEMGFNISTLMMGIISLVFLIGGNIAYRFVYRESCPLLWNSVFFLLDIGFIMLLRLNPELAQKQLLWIFIGFATSLFIPSAFKLLPRLDKLKYVYLGVGIFFLIMTLAFGITEGGSTNWITIKSISFQPSEPVKLFFVFYLASELSEKLTIKKLLLPIGMTCIFILCLVFQKDLGSALIFFMTFMAILYISTANGFLISGGIISFALASAIAYKLFAHVRTRVSVWLDPWSDIDRGGYQVAQSLFAIGTWGVFGSGLTRGMPDFIPVVERDFIFSAICEEFGMLFGLCLIMLLLVIFFRGVKICLNCNNKFLSLVSASLTSLLCFQSFLIIGGVIKLIPLTGVTLPFVSYGGSSMLISFITIGILQWVSTVKIQRK